MIFIPLKVKISSTIKQGAVYYYIEPHFKSPEPHYFTVLNREPFESTTLIVVNASSNISGRLAYIKMHRFSMDTLVIVKPAECGFLKYDSVFDCNFPRVYTPQDLIERLEREAFKYKGDISSIVLEKLKKGITSSTLVTEELKSLI